jgi:hypothetical protein
MDKPFDRSFKDFADQAPELFLTLVGLLPLRPGWKLEVLRAETSPPVLLPDFVALAIGPGGERMLIHLEFFLDFVDWQPMKMSRYGGSLITEYDCEVDSTMILIRPGPPMKQIPEVGEFSKGRTRIVHPFRVIRLWEVSAEPILQNPGLRHLFSLVPALAADWKTIRRIADTILDSGNDEEISRLLLMLSLKYNKSRIDELIGRRKVGFGEILWEGSSLLKDMREKATSEGRAEGLARGLAEGREQGLEQGREQGLEQGREQGLEQGLAQGQAAEARRLLRAVLVDRFPGLEAMSEIDHIPNVATLESLLIDQVLKLTDRTEVEQAIRGAASR